MAIPEEFVAKGNDAELAFMEWLNMSQMTYLRPDQSQFSMPQRDGLKVKRPDFLVGIPGMGSICVEVKGKFLYDHCLTIDWEEVEGLKMFAQAFNLPVYIVRVYKQDPMLWFRLESFYGLPKKELRGKDTVSLSMDFGVLSSYRKDFYTVAGCILHLSSPSFALV